MDLTEITSILEKKTRAQEVSAQSQYTAKIRSGMSGRIAANHEVDVLENELANRKIEKQEMRGRSSALSLKTNQEISDEMTCKKASLALL